MNVVKEARSVATNATRCGHWKDVTFSSSSYSCGKKAWDSKGASDCASLGGLRRRAVSEAHAVEFEFEFEFEFED